MTVLVLVDNLFPVRRLASSKENIWSSVDHKWIFFTEGKAPESVRGCRADMSSLKKKSKLTNWGSSFFSHSSVLVNIVQVLAASAKELNSACHLELMRVCHQVQGFACGKGREEEGV